MGDMRRLILPVLLSISASCAPSASARADQLVPGPDNLRSWVEFISPSKEELAYELVGWRSSFWPAVEEARRLGRPILLWTMNGHPLGCT